MRFWGSWDTGCSIKGSGVAGFLFDSVEGSGRPIFGVSDYKGGWDTCSSILGSGVSFGT